MPEWTIAQQNAISAADCNIVVSAAAGSGKTAVLVERVINIITNKDNPVDIDKLLIVTFTNAAAAEMRSRISSRISQLLEENYNDSNLIRQLSLIPSAKICTIDSFCINLVRENFFNLGIDQDFSIMDESERVLIEKSTADELINECYENASDDFIALVEMFSSTKSDSSLIDMILYLNNYITSQAYPFEWLDSLSDIYNPDVQIDDSVIKKYVLSDISDGIALAERLVGLSKASLSDDDEMFDKYSQMLDDDFRQIKNLDDIISCESWDNIKEAVENISFMRMPSKRNYTSPSKETIKTNRDIYKNTLSEISSYFNLDSVDYYNDCKKVFPLINLLVHIVKDFHNRVMDHKKELNSYTFADIEHFAIELLYNKDDNGNVVKSDIARDYENNFKEILVDEYQDTNYAQDTLFEMISNGKNRFVVGDVKQSIYRFRLAMPYIFNERKSNSIPYDSKSDFPDQKIILDKNFRSRQGICDFTNFVFSAIMSEKVGEMEYTQEEYLNYGANYPISDIPCAQLHIVDVPEEEDADEFEARQIANLILSKIDAKEQISCGDATRNISYGDFAVLFRAPKNRMPVYSRVFAEYGIPTVSNNKTNLFDNNEISILLSLIRVIDNPVQDIPLLATLMSAFYGYSPDDIAQARINHRTGNLYSSISQDEKFYAFLNDIERYRQYASSMSVQSFIMQIIGETSYLSLISAMGNAEQRRENVKKLLDIAGRFDKGNSIGLTAFIRYVDSIIDSGLNIESAGVSATIGDCVSLMSIHQSKGLEFPVCILAGSAHKYNIDEKRNQIQLDNKLGLGVKILNNELMYRYESLQYSVIRNKNDYASMSENLRVLYVAITRAKEQFITFYSKKNVSNAVSNLSNKIINGRIEPEIAKSVLSDGDFIVLCSLLHKNGKALRELCSNSICVNYDADFDLLVSFCSDVEYNSKVKEKCAVYDDQIIDQIKNKLNFVYDRLELSSFVSKRTASSLDDGEHCYDYFASSKPAFLDNSGLTPAQKGSAMHKFMQFCSYENARQNLESEIQYLTNACFITCEEADSLDKEKLEAFFSSDFAGRIFNSDAVYREIKVTSFVKASDLENTAFEDNVLVQGIADCVFEENGELVLVDYKTDKVENEDSLLERYSKQLAFYKQAVSKTLKKPVKEVMLYSFYLNKVCIYK